MRVSITIVTRVRQHNFGQHTVTHMNIHTRRGRAFAGAIVCGATGILPEIRTFIWQFRKMPGAGAGRTRARGVWRWLLFLGALHCACVSVCVLYVVQVRGESYFTSARAATNHQKKSQGITPSMRSVHERCMPF